MLDDNGSGEDIFSLGENPPMLEDFGQLSQEDMNVYFRSNFYREFAGLAPWQSDFPLGEADLDTDIPANVS